MQFGNRHTSAAGNTSGGATGARDPKHTPKKYCSILQYIQHNNRELYDTIGDLLCMSSLFSMRASAPGKPQRELTFLMPKPGSEMHKEIVAAAYGGREHEAIAMIKNCLLWKCIQSIGDFKQGDILRTANHTNAVVDTSGGFLLVGGAKIIADEKFETLFINARFHVYLLESGMLTTTPGDESRSTAAVSGGAWKELRDEKESDSFMKTPAGLADSALHMHIASLRSAGEVPGGMPGWMASQPNEVFYKWGVSLGKYLEAHDSKGFALAKSTWSANPMCVIPFCAMLLDRAVFDAWLKHEDPAGMTYTYAEYLTFVPSGPITKQAIAAPVITSIVRAIQPSEKKKMYEIASLVQHGYESAYPKGGDIPWMAKMVYDEAVFVMNDYIAAAINYSREKDPKDLEKCASLSKIIVHHYTSPNKPWLTNADKNASFDVATNGAMICKLVQFALSEAFMYPNEYCAHRHIEAPLRETAESALKYAQIPPQGPMCNDFTPHVKAFFSKPS